MAKTPAAPTRSKADIEAEITAARARLASNVAALVNEIHPKAVAARTYDNAKRQLKDESGWRTDRVVALATIVGGVSGLILILKSFKKH